MKFAFCVLTLFIASILHAVESRLVGDKIEFAKARVNGVVCWTDEELVSLTNSFSQFAATAPVTVEILTPSNFEITLSSCGIKWGNYSDYVGARDNKNHLDDKLDDLPASQERKARQSVTFLRSENAKR